MLVAREAAMPGDEASVGWVDHLFLDQDGVLTFVEVKRSSDTRIRREVVGQLLDYVSSAVVLWDGAKVRELLEGTAGAVGEAEARVRELLDDGAEIEEFWRQVDVNLRARRVRLLFVADAFPFSLRRIVEFLNETMETVE